MGKYKYNWDKISKDFGEFTDKEIAERHGIDNSRVVAAYRAKCKIPVYTKWSRYAHLLGELPDAEIGAMAGVTANAVTRKRLRDGISCPSGYYQQEEKLRQEFLAWLGEKHEVEARTPCGNIDILTKNCIYECKHILNHSTIKHAVGQLMFYSREYPQHKLAIVAGEVRITDSYIVALQSMSIGLITKQGGAYQNMV